MVSADVLTLGMAADEARRALLPDAIVTYLRVHEVKPEDLVSETDVTVPDAAAEVRTYVLPETLEAAVAQVATLRRLAGTRRVAAFSMAELVARGWSDVDSLRALAAAGLSDVAELPADRLEDLAHAVAALRSAGLHPSRVTVSHPLGDRRVELIATVQQAFETHDCLRRFSPLPRVAPVDKPTTGYDDVRMVALARLALGSRSIEVDWTLYGPKLAQVALTFGADHLDAVAAADDPSLGRRRMTIEDVERNIRAAGFEPKESVRS
jgi:aminodeoxyfutalosine synthase